MNKLDKEFPMLLPPRPRPLLGLLPRLPPHFLAVSSAIPQSNVHQLLLDRHPRYERGRSIPQSPLSLASPSKNPSRLSDHQSCHLLIHRVTVSPCYQICYTPSRRLLQSRLACKHPLA